ncbi:MAG: protein kinase [Planctomycetota bacterium]
MPASSSGHEDSLEAFERDVEAFCEQLEKNPEANAAELLRKYPQHQQTIQRLIAAAGREAQSPNPPLPADPLPEISGYELIRRIGTGGMGEVFEANQFQPIERRVAIKWVRSKFGGPEILRRFANERQSLARMNHPHIAAVLDAGTTANGRPFFVMELVVGENLITHCQQQELPLSKRIELLRQVCGGLEHAHRRGIIHRDIKPSNVLVGTIDGQAVPKIIDFGLAKAVAATGDDQLDESESKPLPSSHTTIGQVLGTLEYMSPEQATLRPEDVETRSDVFAMGVLLFELITGTVPLRGQVDSAIPLDEQLRRVREQEPVRPSTLLNRSRVDGPGEHAAWQRQVRGDLDAVCTKAMASSPSDRYESAAEFSSDLASWLKGHPVGATRHSDIQQFLRLVRHYRRPLLVTSAVLLLLVAATMISVISAGRARMAERLADERLQAVMVAREDADRNLYIARLNLAQQAALSNDLQSALDHLAPYESVAANSGTVDQSEKRTSSPRGPEWSLLRSRLEIYGGQTRFSDSITDVRVVPNSDQLLVADVRGKVMLVDSAAFSDTTGARVDQHVTASWQLSDRMVGRFAVGPAGRWAVVPLQTNQSVLLDLRQPQKSPVPLDLGMPARSAAISPDGQRIAVGGVDGVVGLFEIQTGRFLRDLQIDSDSDSGIAIYCLAFSGDGRVAAGCLDRKVRIWNAESGLALETLRGAEGRVRSIIIHASRDEASGGQRLRLFAAGNDKNILVWDISDAGSARFIRTQTGHAERIYDLSISPDGRRVASSDRSGIVWLWDSASGKPIDRLPAHRNTAYSARFSDNQTLVTAAHDKTLRQWRIRQDGGPRTLLPHRDTIWQIEKLDNETVITCSEDGGVAAIHCQSGRELCRLQFDAPLTAVATIPHEPYSTKSTPKLAIVGDARGSIHLLSCRGGEAAGSSRLNLRQLGQYQPVDSRKQLVITGIVVTPDGRDCYTTGGAGLQRFRLTQSDAGSQTLVPQPLPEPWADDQWVGDTGDAIAVSPDGRQMAVSITDGPVLIGPVLMGPLTSASTVKSTKKSNGPALLSLTDHRDRVVALRFTPDGKSLLLGGRDQVIMQHCTETGKRQRLLSGHTASIHDLRFDESGQRLYSAGSDERVKVWDYPSGEFLCDLHGPLAQVHSLVLLRDGQNLVVSEGPRLQLWHGDDDDPVASNNGPSR